MTRARPLRTPLPEKPGAEVTTFPVIGTARRKPGLFCFACAMSQESEMEAPCRMALPVFRTGSILAVFNEHCPAAEIEQSTFPL